jgi:hypothetical protein
MASADHLPEDDWDRRLRETLGGAQVPATPPGLEARVQHLVRRRRWQHRAAWGVAAAAMVGMAGLALWELSARPKSLPSALALGSSRTEERVEVLQARDLILPDMKLNLIAREDVLLGLVEEDLKGTRR